MITECFYIQWRYNLKCKDVRQSLCWCWHLMLLMLHPLNKWVTETKGNHPSWAEEVRGHQLHSELSWFASGFQCPQVLPCVIRVRKVTTHQVALWLDLTNKSILTEGMVLVCATQHGLKYCVFLPSICPSIHPSIRGLWIAGTMETEHHYDDRFQLTSWSCSYTDILLATGTHHRFRTHLRKWRQLHTPRREEVPPATLATSLLQVSHRCNLKIELRKKTWRFFKGCWSCNSWVAGGLSFLGWNPFQLFFFLITSFFILNLVIWMLHTYILHFHWMTFPS